MASPDQDDRRKSRRSSARSTAAGTPNNALRQLANAVQIPTTPGNYNASSRRASTRRSPAAPATPHGLRARQRRQTTYTPGRDRRKSGRVQRETPLDILRNLGKALAPTTRPVSSSPEEEQQSQQPADEPEYDGMDDFEDEPDIPRPRLSLPLNDMVEGDEDDDAKLDMRPPRRSILVDDDDDMTQKSIEMPRRERPPRDTALLSRRSFASTRFSDHFGDLSRMDETEAMDVAIAQEQAETGPEEEEQLETTPGQPVFDAGGETEDLRRFNLDFSFPTPEAPAEAPEGLVGEDYEDFVLDTGGPGVESPPVPGEDAGAGIENASPDEPGQSAQRSPSPLPELQDTARAKHRKEKKLSRHGIPVPNLPSGIVKKLATRFSRSGKGANTRISKDTLAAVEQATEWFFEQASDDVATYSKHAGRRTIDESDMIALMRRQRHVGKNTSVFALAQKHLPKELLQDVRLPRK